MELIELTHNSGSNQSLVKDVPELSEYDNGD